MHFAGLVVTIGLFVGVAANVDALGNPPSWAEENAKGRFPYHRLTASDFPIDDAAYPQFGMHTQGFFRFHYNHRWTENNGRVVARVTDWNIWSGFDRNKSSRKSWFKKLAETLPHEQGHLDLSELHSKAFAETPIDKLPIGEGATAKEAEADLQRKMSALSSRISAQNQSEQDRYDAETNHGANASKQREWEAAIQARLGRAGIHF
jgi:Bacterial protein of unknown function (DUF922)